MMKIKIRGCTADEIGEYFVAQHQGLVPALGMAAALAQGSANKRIYEYQAAALFTLASEYDRERAEFLEVGTYYGYSAAVLAQAAPRAKIITINPVAWEYEPARTNLKGFGNVRCLCVGSQEYLERYDGPELELIFIDGDHKQIRKDVRWWNHLAVNGLILFHDYTPEGAPRHCPPVFEALNEMAEKLGREPDVLIVDDLLVGMAGWIKKPGDGRL